MQTQLTRFCLLWPLLLTVTLGAGPASAQPPTEAPPAPPQPEASPAESAPSASPPGATQPQPAPAQEAPTAQSPEEADASPSGDTPAAERDPEANAGVAQAASPPAASSEGETKPAPSSIPEVAASTKPDKEKQYPEFQPSLRLMTGFERTSETRFASGDNLTTERYGFFLGQARAQLEGKLTKRISLELSAELADAYEAEVVTTANKPPYLRDAFVNLRVKRAFQITLGHFKRPISALEHRNAGRLQVRGRGLTNDLVIEDNGWGSRALGMQFWGKIKAIRSSWAVGVFDPAWTPTVATRPKGVDLLARYSVEPVAGLTLGVNGGMKTLDTPPFDEYETFYGIGGDLHLELGGLDVLLDSFHAQLPQVASDLEHQSAMGVVGLVSYDIPITPVLSLQPVVLGEYSDASTAHEDSESLRAVGGLNLLVHETLRIMPQAELVRWLGDPSELSPNEGTAFYVMVSLAL